MGSSDVALVMRDEAVRGMQTLEQRAAQARVGTAEQTVQAMTRLAGQTAAAVQHTAESSQHAVTTLEDQTREAFGRTETALGSVQDELVSNAQKITNLETALMEERHRHA